MGDLDKRNRLGGQIFSYQATKDGKIFIYWQGKLVTTLKAAKAERLLEQIEGADEKTIQLALAKVTGNFKRGNER